MKRTFLQFVVAAAFVIVLSSNASAKMWFAVLDGKCIDERGQPCVNAKFHLSDPTNGRVYNTQTDSKGKFYHAGVEPGDYNVTVSRPGQADVELTAALSFSILPLLVTVDLGKHYVHVGQQILMPDLMAPIAGPLRVGSETQITNPMGKEIESEFQQGHWLNVIRILKSAIRRDPNNAGLHALLAYADYEASQKKLGKADEFMKECVEEYSAAIAIKPDPRYYNNLGTVYVRIRRFEEAIQQFKTAEGLLPIRATLYERNIGVTLVGQSYDLPEAESIAALQRASETFTRVLSAEPQNEDVLYWKGLALLRLAAAKPGSANYDEVASIFRRYLEIAPNGRFAKDVNGMLASIRTMPRPQNQ